MSGNSKEAYNTLKTLIKTQQDKSAVVEDSGGNIVMESTAVLNHWTEYCSGLHNYELHPDTSFLQSNQTPKQEDERSCSALSSANSSPRLRNCWQKNKQVLDLAGAQ